MGNPKFDTKNFNNFTHILNFLLRKVQKPTNNGGTGGNGVQSVTGRFVNNSDPSNPVLQPTEATQTTNGLMSSTDYKKLNTLGNFTDDVEASAAGVPVNGFYHTGGVLKINLGAA